MRKQRIIFQRKLRILTELCRIIDVDYCYGRPDWCPLRELPEKKPHTEDVLEVFINTGYNACIDELLKEE